MAGLKTEQQVFVGVILDFETGGLNCVKNAITQIAMKAVRMDTWEVIDEYVRYVSPYTRQDTGSGAKRKVLKNKHEVKKEELMEYEAGALMYSAITMEMLNLTGEDLKRVAEDVIDFGKRVTLTSSKQAKPVIIGQNVFFDVGFLQQLMNYGGMVKEFEKTFAGSFDFYGNFQPHYVDIIDLGHLCFADNPEVASYKLELICERLGVELDDAHDADADVTATLNAMIVYANRLRNQNDGGGASLHKKEKTRLHFKI